MGPALTSATLSGMAQPGEFNATPEQLAVGMLVALGVLVIVRDLLKFADTLKMHSQAEEYLSDPNKLAEEALEHLGQDPSVADRGYPREEEQQDG